MRSRTVLAVQRDEADRVHGVPARHLAIEPPIIEAPHSWRQRRPDERIDLA